MTAPVTIYNPYHDLAGRTVVQYQFDTEARALTEAEDHTKSYLYHSHTIEAYYLYVPVEMILVSIVHRNDVIKVTEQTS